MIEFRPMIVSPGTFAGITRKEVLSIGVAKPGGCNPRALGGLPGSGAIPKGSRDDRMAQLILLYLSFELFRSSLAQTFQGPNPINSIFPG